MQVQPFNTTSKILTWITLFFYVIIMIASIICKIVLKEDITFAVSFLHQLISIVFTYYFCKSGLENVVGIIVEKMHTVKFSDLSDKQE